MVKSINDFLTTWKYEKEATLKILNNLTDSSLSQKVEKVGRTLGFIAWHITMTIPEMLSKTGLPFKFDENSAAPASARTIVAEYEKLSDTVSELIAKEWKDEMLNDDLNMYGQVWKRADVLFSLIVHQTHHRGQMTVLMRQAGLKVPGVYGPSREEWTSFGMPEQK